MELFLGCKLEGFSAIQFRHHNVPAIILVDHHSAVGGQHGKRGEAPQGVADRRERFLGKRSDRSTSSSCVPSIAETIEDVASRVTRAVSRPVVGSSRINVGTA